MTSIDQKDKPLARWQRATVDMADFPDLDDLFQDDRTVHASVLSDNLLRSLKDTVDDAPGRPVLDMLVSILGMHEMPGRIPPFGPRLVMGDGSRSAQPSDFDGPLVEVVVAISKRVNNPVVRARLGHLAWFLERRRREEGFAALHGYIEILKGLDDGTFEARGERGIISTTGRDLLRSAFAVCRGIGRPPEEFDQLKRLNNDLLRRAAAANDGFGLQVFSKLAFDESALDPADIADIMDMYLEQLSVDPSTGGGDDHAQLLIFLSRLRKRCRDEVSANAALVRASEIYAKYAESFVGQPQGSFSASHWMGLAISTLHGVPDVRQRRQELRDRLIDIQGAIQDDLLPISHSTDISDLVGMTRARFSNLSLEESLKHFTFSMGYPPEPEKLVEEAKQSNAQHPLASFFASSYMDFEGKTIARSSGGGLSVDEPSPEVLEPTIMRSESIRRGFAARAGIDVARATIMAEHNVSEDYLLKLVRHSPSLPPYLVHTAGRGFARWFEGDTVSALYILTPILEGILRHLLKQHGHDVTTMNDATQTQEDRTITSLYDAMRPEMDAILGKAVTDDIWRTFLSKMGPSLRHGVAHALLSDGIPYGDDAIYACWLIWLIVFWPLHPEWGAILK